jgi:hypothetical protein
MADAITLQLIDLGYLSPSVAGKREFDTLATPAEEAVQAYAQNLCLTRNYPTALSERMRSHL